MARSLDAYVGRRLIFATTFARRLYDFADICVYLLVMGILSVLAKRRVKWREREVGQQRNDRTDGENRREGWRQRGERVFDFFGWEVTASGCCTPMTFLHGYLCEASVKFVDAVSSSQWPLGRPSVFKRGSGRLRFEDQHLIIAFQTGRACLSSFTRAYHKRYPLPVIFGSAVWLQTFGACGAKGSPRSYIV